MSASGTTQNQKRCPELQGTSRAVSYSGRIQSKVEKPSDWLHLGSALFGPLPCLSTVMNWLPVIG
jgi:hypothetical protein